MKKINTKPQPKKSTGQVLVIFGISLVILLLFVGLALDAGSVYVTYGQLKRAVDSAAISAANEFKRGANTTAMTNTAKEVMSAMNIDVTDTSLQLNLYICDENNNTVYIIQEFWMAILMACVINIWKPLSINFIYAARIPKLRLRRHRKNWSGLKPPKKHHSIFCHCWGLAALIWKPIQYLKQLHWMW